MVAKAKEFASLRLSGKLREKVSKMARAEKRTLSQMIRILVEESIDHRTGVSADKLEAKLVADRREYMRATEGQV